MTRQQPGRLERFLRRRQLRRLERALAGIAELYEANDGGVDDVRRLEEATRALRASAFDQDDLNELSHRYDLRGIDARDERPHPRWLRVASKRIEEGRRLALELRVVRWWNRTGVRPPGRRGRTDPGHDPGGT